ncbi:hypothetical protein ACFL27_26235 [candidate division CSSED10-310 bacterium]|uniref:Uncharacterized protein n=1 Tax=candidate division CSSED10-310 bacterium TaxID=2855610 RepID=A0ABV6Z5H3_UNCC1
MDNYNQKGVLEMGESVLLVRDGQLTTIPGREWETEVSHSPPAIRAGLTFMTAEHHQVRYFVVRELPRIGAPLSPEFIASKLNLPLPLVDTILTELEENLTFLFRNKQGHVAWAYPVTVDETPHHVTFSSGEQVFAA